MVLVQQQRRQPHNRHLWLAWFVLSCPPALAATEEVDFFKTKNIYFGGKRWGRIPDPFAEGHFPYPPKKDYTDVSVKDEASIMVLIAALGEKRLVDTIESMFKRAKNSKRIYIGIIQQNAAKNEDALEGICRRLGTPLELRSEFVGRPELLKRQTDEDLWGQSRYTPESFAACEPAGRIRVFRMTAREARGPAYARARQPLLLSQGAQLEDFCMQIDAHTVFLQDWDDFLLGDWATTKNEYAVLTTYPTGSDQLREDGSQPNVNNHWEMPVLCEAQMLGPGLVRNAQASAVANLDKPCLSKLWAAGLSFARCHAERDVPNDPQMQGIFMGEEFSRASRLWTNGYDLYAITRPVIVTYYGADKKNTEGFNHGTPEQAKKARDRQATLVKFQGADLSQQAVDALRGYGMGNRRNFEDYIAITGVDTVHHKYRSTPCYVKRWYPWKDGSDPPYEMLRDSPLNVGNDIRTMLEDSGDIPRREPARDAAEHDEASGAASAEGSQPGDQGKDAAAGGPAEANLRGGAQQPEALPAAEAAGAPDKAPAVAAAAGSVPGAQASATNAGSSAVGPMHLPLGLETVVWDGNPDHSLKMLPVTVVVGLVLSGMLIFLWLSRKCRRRGTKRR
eukprot:TRINITY_DN20732_c0_g1_i2.p1 TRINITY_DN20732_c0_g1~~TRINITY_DN20732_c0_g1_i2.p1  ORF type:complete len:620 (-),score=128.81 TRINITY_DN20732_c0_g1_i2:145-2004(-)